MGAVKITREKATKARTCENRHPIPVGAFYCHVDLAPGQPRRSRSDWGYVDSYCEVCGTKKYARYRRILALLDRAATTEAARSAHMECMDTEEVPVFDINHHRWVASQMQSGRATAGLIEGSHEQLLAEVERLTYLVSPAKLQQPARTEPVPADNVLALIDALAKHPRSAAVQVEYMGMKSSPWFMGSYRGYYDQLAIHPDGPAPQTVGDVLKTLRAFKRKGFPGDGGPYPVETRTGVWVDRGQAEGQHLSGVRVEGGIVVVMTEGRDW